MIRSYFVLIVAVLIVVSGCGGPSTEDLMMRAAQRRRNDDEESASEKKPQSDNQVAASKQAEGDGSSVATSSSADAASVSDDGPQQSKATPTSQTASSNASGGDTPVKPSDVLASIGELSIKPIDQRAVDKTDDQDACRRRAADNLTKIAAALQKYHKDKGSFPAPRIKTENGVATLSWRVALLPYLGHDALYKKFDPSRPWNYEPNLSLMQYIPDVYVSPERYDVKTNYQLPVFRTFMFGGDRGRRVHDVDDEDGAANTIMLLEVNDELAVEWTKPADYVPTDLNNLQADLGDLRGDGTFAAWANGWTTLLANSLSQQQLYNSLTFDAGDGQLAGEVHRDIPLVEAVAGDAKSPSESKLASSGTDGSADKRRAMAVDSLARQVQAATARQRLPIAVDLAKAQSRLREIYRDKIVAAKTDSEKAKLAQEMLDQSSQMLQDPAGAYALQSAAIWLSSESGTFKSIIEAVDQRVGRFEVNAYEENITALLKFAETAGRQRQKFDVAPFLKRCVRVVYAAIKDDDYQRASELVAHASRLTNQESQSEIKKSWIQLRVMLTTAEREYKKSAVSLANYRNDPDAVNDAATFGRFLCCIKGDWETGLPLVAMGDPQSLRELATQDIAGAKSVDDQVALGDAWWRMSQSIRGGVYRQSLLDRAAYWYQMAWSVMPESLDKIHVKNRLDELQESTATSPMGAIEQIAQDMGVNLNESLISIAGLGQRQRSDHGDDDDD